MKISKEDLMRIIKEELEAEFGKIKTTRGQASSDLKTRAKDVQSQKGVDDKERGIINQIEKLLSQLADKTDIKSGQVNTKLKRLYNVLQQELGDQQDEE